MLIYSYWKASAPRTTSIYLSPDDQISSQEVPKEEHEVFKIIKEINEKNEKIKSIYISNMPIRLQQGRLTIKVSGEMAMQKEKNFRLKIDHRLTGREMDIGSNDTYFWFWSKRMDPPDLNYSKHENLNKTMLRTTLNPNWMLESLNVSTVDIKNIEISKYKNFWKITQPRIASTNELVKIITLIDPEQKVVVGRYLYNQENKMIASTEYQDFYRILPKKIYIMWYEEEIALEWDLSTAKINVDINPEFWSMPNIKNKIEIGK